MLQNDSVAIVSPVALNAEAHCPLLNPDPSIGANARARVRERESLQVLRLE
jgi:hypothetical protein